MHYKRFKEVREGCVVSFPASLKKLKEQRNELPERELEVIFHRVVSGVDFISRHYDKWWKLVDVGEIDVNHIDQSPLHLVVRRSEVQKPWLGRSEEYEHGFIPFSFLSDERVALNEFWNEAIRVIKSDPDFALFLVS